MKVIRNITILLGTTLALLALASTRANAQALTTSSFYGTFTLPFEAQWGSMILPAGDYTLYYGQLNGSGTYLVEVMGNEEASEHGILLPGPGNQVSESESALVCLREGNHGYVHELRMGAIGKSVSFPIPHGVEVRARIVADSVNPESQMQVGQASMAVERIPVKLMCK